MDQQQSQWRVGVVGAGNISPIYLEAPGKFGAFEVAAIADLDVNRARERADQYGVGLALGVKELLTHPDVDALLAAFARKGFVLSRAELDEVVAHNDKGRFGYDEPRERIRAHQGHSVPVDLGLTPLTPPARLYHGTPRAAVAAILEDGLRPMSRHHVHLSSDVPTALRVGARRGAPVILEVRADEMHAAGHLFYRSDNGVWLTDAVPPAYLGVRS